MGKKLKGFTVGEVVALLLQQDQNKICMVGDSQLIPFPLRIEHGTFYKHPESDDTILKVDSDDPDRDFIISEFEQVDAVVFVQDKQL